ncbi:GntR family transcriptional regulator [soil metagenome]
MATRAITSKKAARASVAQVAFRGTSEAASSPEKVVDAIHRGILAGRYVPGQKLIEADLTESLGVSRGPVREALKRLDAEGVVELTRHRGAYVRSLTRAETIDLLEILELLTGLIARRAALAVAKDRDPDSPSTRKLQDAFKWLERFKDSSLENSAFLEQRSHFYDVLIAVGGNSQLQSVMPMMRIHLLRLQVQPFFSTEERQDRLDEYAAITAAVLNGDNAEARKAMRYHMKRMTQRIGRLPDEVFARA